MSTPESFHQDRTAAPRRLSLVEGGEGAGQRSPQEIKPPSPPIPSEPIWLSPAPVELTPEMESRIMTIWAWFGEGNVDRATLHREIAYAEQGVPKCESCRVRGGLINDSGYRVCGSCFNGGRR